MLAEAFGVFLVFMRFAGNLLSDIHEKSLGQGLKSGRGINLKNTKEKILYYYFQQTFYIKKHAFLLCKEQFNLRIKLYFLVLVLFCRRYYRPL